MSEHSYIICGALLKNHQFMLNFYRSAIKDIKDGKISEGIGKFRAFFNYKIRNDNSEVEEFLQFYKDEIKKLRSEVCSLKREIQKRDDVFRQNSILRLKLSDARRAVYRQRLELTQPFSSIEWFGGESCP